MQWKGRDEAKGTPCSMATVIGMVVLKAKAGPDRVCGAYMWRMFWGAGREGAHVRTHKGLNLVRVVDPVQGHRGGVGDKRTHKHGFSAVAGRRCLLYVVGSAGEGQREKAVNSMSRQRPRFVINRGN